MSEPLKIAFLGPEGTYTHQAAREVFGDSVQYVEQETIAKTCESVSCGMSYAVVPQENSIYGAVIDTYDALRSPTIGSEAFIQGEVTINIQHCLVARHGVNLQDITQIISHEQALGQCTEYISRNLPQATVIKSTSTAAAARAIIARNRQEIDSMHCAAICSKLCTIIYEGFNVIQESIQDIKDNFTRFYIISSASVSQTPFMKTKHPPRALLSIIPKTQGLDVALLAKALQLRITRLDRRPSRQGQPFHDMYFVEVESQGLEDEFTSWKNQIDMSIARVSELECDVKLLGFW